MTLAHSTHMKQSSLVLPAVGSALLLVNLTPVSACDVCAIYSAQQAQGGNGKGWFGGVAEQFTHFGSLQDSGHRIDNDVNQHLDSSVTQIFGGYNFNDQLAVQFNVPLISRSWVRPRGTVMDHGSLSGVGDVTLIGNYTVYRREKETSTFSWNLLGGVKFPTGDASRLGEDDVPGVTLPDSGIAGHDLALGSGSYDGIIGTGFFARWKKLMCSGTTQYAIRGTGSFDHKYANDLTWSGGPGVYLWLKENYTLTLQAIVSGEVKGKDTVGGVPDDDSAGTIVNVGPQLNLTWSNRLSAQLGADLPVIIHNTGLQAVPDYRLRAALTWRF